MRLISLTLLIIAALFTSGLPVIAQEDPEPPPGRLLLDEVYVTTQYNSRLRLGPSQLWEPLTTIPAGTTLRATGRTAEPGWLQVAYEGDLDPGASTEGTIDGVTYGWIADFLLRWTGDILLLPVDGVETVRDARRSAPRIVIDPETRVYRDGIDPSTLIEGLVTEPVEVELTGRIGSPEGGYYWLQFEYNDRYYWTATWEVGDIPLYTRLPDGSYIYTYGRLLRQLRTEISRNGIILNSIGSRWRNLDEGREVSCNTIPADASIGEESFTEADLQTETIYIPTARALEDAIESTNEAIARFREVCSRTGEDRIVQSSEVQDALNFVNEASRNLTLARTLLQPLERRDPLLGERPIAQDD